VDIFQKLSKQFQEQMKRYQRIEQDIARKEKQIVDVMASSVSGKWLLFFLIFFIDACADLSLSTL
jgi:hypothetical protein